MLEDAWDTIGASIGIAEDYYGFYDDSFLEPIQAAIDDMLVEAAPRTFWEKEVDMTGTGATANSPVHLLNIAWNVFFDDPDGYRRWEEGVVDYFLEGRISD